MHVTAETVWCSHTMSEKFRDFKVLKVMLTCLTSLMYYSCQFLSASVNYISNIRYFEVVFFRKIMYYLFHMQFSRLTFVDMWKINLKSNIFVSFQYGKDESSCKFQ